MRRSGTPYDGGGVTDQQRRDGFVLVIDRHPLTCGGICDLLATMAADLTVIAAASPEQAAELGTAQQASLAIYNAAQRPVGEEPVAADLAMLRRDLPGVPVALLSSTAGDDLTPAQAMRLGLRGHFLPSFAAPVLIAAIRLILAGGSYFPPVDRPSRPPSPTTPAITPRDIAELTRRESEVLDKLCQGKANKVIAFELAMSENTVKVHVYRIMKKLNAANRTEVVSIMQRQGDQAAP